MSPRVRSRVDSSYRRPILTGGIALACAVAAFVVPPGARAATISSNWTLNNNGTWSTSANWSASGIPTAAGDTAIINANITGTRTITIDGAVASRTLGILTIGDTDTTNSYTINASGGGTLTFDNSGSAAQLNMSSSSVGDTLNLPILLNGALNITNSSSSATLTIGTGSITSASAGTKALTIAAGNVTISGGIAPGSGDISITKNGTGNLTLSGTNTFTGGVTLNAGTLTLNSTTALGAASSTLTITAGTLAGNTTLANANAIAWNGNFAFGGTTNLNLGAATVTMNGSHSLALGSTAGTSLTITNGIAETISSKVTFTNSGTQTTTIVNLNGANAYTGGTDINGGVIKFANASAIPSTGTHNVQTNGALQVAGVHTTLADWLADSHLSTASTGALALTATSTESFAPGTLGFNNISLGATVGTSISYTGTYTPGSAGYFVGGGGGTITFSNANTFTGSVALTAGNGGGGTVILTASNDNLTNTVTIGNGTLQLGNNGTTGSINGVTNVVDNGTLTFARTDNLNFSIPISGTGGITKNTANTLTIGNSNSYSGTTAIGGGTLIFTAAQTLTGGLTFGSTLGGTTAANLDLTNTGASATFGSLAVQTNTSTANAITIGSGNTLTINGSTTVGYNLGSVAVGSTATTNLTISGAGALVVKGTSAIVAIGAAQTTQLTNATASTLDLTALSSVTLGNSTTAISELRVGYGQSAGGTVLFSNTSNLVTATTINVGNSNSANGGVGILTLGIGTNTLRADTINIGFSKVNGTISFASQAAGTGSVVITNKAGSGGANITVGSQNATGTAAVLVGTLDLRGHSSTITAGTLTVGNNNNNNSTGSAAGVVYFDTGTFNATTVNLGQKSSTGTGSNATTNSINVSGTGAFNVSGVTTMSANTATSTSTAANVTSALNISGGSYTTGTFLGGTKTGTGIGNSNSTINVSGGSFSITGNSFVLATQSGAGTVTTGLNITGGTVTTAADITDGGGATTTSITLDGGTLNLAGHNIGGANLIDSLTFASGTLQSVGQINAGAGLTKVAGSGSNQLILAGNNTYTGSTTVSSGILLVNGTITGSPVAVNAGVLGGAGQINLTTGQNVAVAATLAPGSNGIGELTVAGGNGVAFAANSTFSIETGQGVSDKLTISGGGNLDLSAGGDLLNVVSTAPGSFTIASWTGTRSGFFDFVTINGANESYTTDTVGSVTTYTFTSGDGSLVYDDTNRNMVLTVVVPEPASALSLVLGTSGLLGFARLRTGRRKR